MLNYEDHWWLADNKPGFVFSTSIPGWIAVNDSRYIAFTNSGGLPSKILCDGELADVLVKAGVDNSIVAACGCSAWGAVTGMDVQNVVLALGVILTSTATPSLNSTYEVSGQLWQNMFDEAVYVKTFNAFSTGNSTTVMQTRTGQVSFSDTTTFLSVFKALMDYISAWRNYLNNGGTAPTLGSVSIA